MGVTRMRKKNAIVRRLPSIETLGCTEVICSDKTGTLMRNRMTVVSEFCPSSAARAALLQTAALCNDAFLLDSAPNRSQGSVGKWTGDPTETALVEYCALSGYDKTALDKSLPRVNEIAFDSGRKRMTTVHKNAGAPAPDGGFNVCCKGAPDVLIRLCSHYYAADGREIPLDDGARARILERNGAEAKQGRRVLAFARKVLSSGQLGGDNSGQRSVVSDRLGGDNGGQRSVVSDQLEDKTAEKFPSSEGCRRQAAGWLPEKDQNPNCELSIVNGALDLESGLTFLGLLAMADPVRPEAAAAVEKCKRAGIRPVMITGDHMDTAVAVARELGIISHAREAMTGAELDALTDGQFQKAIEKYGVYARVSPENKVRIVKAWRARGKVCAMTGDGVNDAPALKNADIGVGMGLSGTDAAKQAADIVLADDNFATIVLAVEEGRKIYDNIRKTIQFLLSTNLSEVLTLFLSGIFGGNGGRGYRSGFAVLS
ncbi:hypothetical protein FACS1894211_16690 [Clostridia bacterium]|nr:hypothetical protein FACS1894211_16690 [Clostridia bacterium]